MSSSEVPAVVTVIGAILSAVNVTIDPNLITGAVQGVVAIVTLIAAVVAWYKHRQLAK